MGNLIVVFLFFRRTFFIRIIGLIINDALITSRQIDNQFYSHTRCFCTNNLMFFENDKDQRKSFFLAMMVFYFLIFHKSVINCGHGTKLSCDKNDPKKRYKGILQLLYNFPIILNTWERKKERKKIIFKKFSVSFAFMHTNWSIFISGDSGWLWPTLVGSGRLGVTLGDLG